MQVQLHTFLFADISGYSALTEREGDEAAAEIALRFAAEVARIAPEHGAELVRTIGDAVMVHCLNADEAIALALRIRECLECDGDGRPGAPIHAGIHTGPAVSRAGEWWGATVNVAARLAAAAEAGQVLVSAATRQVAGDSRRVDLRACGSLRLKNISAPVEVLQAA